MALPSTSLVLMYASLARAPEFAMTLASKMASSAFEARDHAGVQRWVDRYAELKSASSENEDPSPHTEVSCEIG